MTSPSAKIMTLEQAVEWRKKLRAEGRALALTNGCFDILHRGHAEYLITAGATADALVILLNSDDSVRRLKGPERPLNSEKDRAFILACLSFVDAVVIFDSQRCDAEIKALSPDSYVKGGDYTVETLDPDERAAILACGAKINLIPFVKGYSTTGIIGRMRK